MIGPRSVATWRAAFAPQAKKVNKQVKRGFPDKIRRAKRKQTRVFAPGKKQKKR